MEPFEVEAAYHDRTAIVALSGELDLEQRPTLLAAVELALQGTPSHLELDLSDLTFIDSSGLAALHEALALSASAGADLALTSPSDSVRKVLKLTGYDTVFTVLE